MKKISSYQKLKAKNRELRQDIRTLVLSPDSMEALRLKAKYTFQYQAEDAIMYGHSTTIIEGNVLLN